MISEVKNSILELLKKLADIDKNIQPNTYPWIENSEIFSNEDSRLQSLLKAKEDLTVDDQVLFSIFKNSLRFTEGIVAEILKNKAIDEITEQDITVYLKELQTQLSSETIYIQFVAPFVKLQTEYFDADSEKVVEISDDLSLVKLSSEERDVFYLANHDNFITGERVEKEEHVFAVKGKIPIDRGEVENLSADAVYDSIIPILERIQYAFLLNGWRAIDFESITILPTDFLPFLPTGAVYLPNRLFPKGNYICPKYIEEMPNQYKKLCEIWDVTLDISLRRLRGSLAREDSIDAIIDITIGMETVLLQGRKESIAKEFALRYSFLKKQSERTSAYKKAKDLYKLRSKFVHGSSAMDISAYQKKYNFGTESLTIHDISSESSDFLKDVILFYIQHKSSSDAASFNEGYWNAYWENQLLMSLEGRSV